MILYQNLVSSNLQFIAHEFDMISFTDKVCLRLYPAWLSRISFKY